MNKMLNSTISMMSYHNNNRFSSSTSPSKTSSTTSSSSSSNYRRSREYSDDIIYSTDLIGSDYFVSSLDFEYDLFLNGLVNCDNSGYRNRIRPQYKDLYDLTFVDSSSGTANRASPTNNNSYRDEIAYSNVVTSRRDILKNSGQPKSPNQDHHSLLFTTTADSLFAALNSPLHRAATSYKHLQKPQKQQAIANDYINLSFAKANNSSQSNQQTNTSTVPLQAINNGKNQPNIKISSNTNTGGSTQTTKSTSEKVTALTLTQNPTITTSAAIHCNQQQSNKNETTNVNQINQKIPATVLNDPQSTTLDETVDISENLSHQHLHALHRFRQQKKKGLIGRLKDVVISFTPKARGTVVNRDDIYSRFGKEEKETLAAFDFLNQIKEEGVDELQDDQALSSKESRVNELLDVNEPENNYIDTLEIDLHMEEYDLLNPCICDTNNVNGEEQIDVNDQQEIEDVNGTNQFNKNIRTFNDSLQIASDSAKIQSSQSDYNHQSNSGSAGETASSTTAPTTSITTMANTIENGPLASSSSSSSSKSSHHQQQQQQQQQSSIKKFRFGFPRKSNSLEFQSTSTMKQLNDCTELSQQQDDESISGSRSVQEPFISNDLTKLIHRNGKGSNVNCNNSSNSNTNSSSSPKYFLSKNRPSKKSSKNRSNSNSNSDSCCQQQKKKSKCRISSFSTTTTTTTTTTTIAAVTE